MVETARHKPDYPLLTIVGILVPLGVVMVYSASFVDAFTNHGNQLYYAWRQLGAALIGLIAMLIIQRIDYRIWRKYSVVLLGITLVLLVLTLVLPASITTVNAASVMARLGYC
ncbi:MAG TPA: FtsW/RodA/SpoVE family cell cycle protein, partial [Roseiflexaceae bacterium]|nr:FtsW/RodA/SpoVE family cell cycle protein [Roseiflexaceae bacterium]